jgi:hypothetical protein
MFSEAYNPNKYEIIDNNVFIRNYLINQDSIPKVLIKHNMIVRTDILKSFYTVFKHVITVKNLQYLWGIYVSIILEKKIITMGYSEPEQILAIFACHFDSTYRLCHVQTMLKELVKFCDKIHIVYSINITNDDLKIHSSFNNLIEVSKVINKGHDCGKWYYGLSKENFSKYDRILLLNNSICNLRELDDIFSFVQGKNVEMIGMIDSNEIKYHIQSHFRFYTPSGIQKIIPFLKKCWEKEPSFNIHAYIVNNFEINTNIFTNYETYYSVKDLSYKQNIHFDNEKLFKKIKDENYPLCKIKNIITII